MTSEQLITRETITAFFTDLQDRICQALADADGMGQFREDAWERPGGGGGRSRTIADGAVIEKGGVGFSAVQGAATEATLRSLNLTEPAEFYATGVSIVLHPRNPMVPIIHMNVRYFEMSTGQSWFGGGIDLTPHYVVDEDARWFHAHLKAVCDRHDPAYHPKFKTWADDYFFIPHRQETRGVGGIFFDYLKPADASHKAELFAFVQDVGNAFAPIYTHFMRQNRDLPFGEREKQWQLLRRGRYVEFNLVWDRGTKFGLETNGRTESILMSMPPQANWTYDFRPEPGSQEERTLSLLRKGVDWV
ncbi:oxygen-dependent coproporphyrinogen oxidase [Spirosoma oryzicola]|uniref:oxygen-dependent coproporphyrinogen oxidase n=1 Tax=Spirosoma oryzicola TaxID=2898794 RepID=UPI001E33D683|nr:oxygen-dependent coproporphyrinogen oxidase [Spirosoma oryzicola]UHG89540.1 oxygen-dependent coproporphyrinogen oxidase [Spirosoma oryzicola]